MIIALNNKSNLTKDEFVDYIEKLNSVSTIHKIILCPNFLNISQFESNKIKLGAQNVSKDLQGAYTGEVAAEQLKSYGVEYCIVGHSERREYQKEDNKVIREKIVRLLEKNITPILCIGETKEEYEQEKTKEILKEEIESAIQYLTKEELNKMIIAYEPIWSIGTGIIPTVEEIDNILEYIKKILPNSKVLYGGSANDDNIDKLNKSKYIDGYLLGGLSLKPEKLKIFLSKINK